MLGTRGGGCCSRGEDGGWGFTLTTMAPCLQTFARSLLQCRCAASAYRNLSEDVLHRHDRYVLGKEVLRGADPLRLDDEEHRQARVRSLCIRR